MPVWGRGVPLFIIRYAQSTRPVILLVVWTTDPIYIHFQLEMTINWWLDFDEILIFLSLSKKFLYGLNCHFGSRLGISIPNSKSQFFHFKLIRMTSDAHNSEYSWVEQVHKVWVPTDHAKPVWRLILAWKLRFSRFWPPLWLGDLDWSPFKIPDFFISHLSEWLQTLPIASTHG